MTDGERTTILGLGERLIGSLPAQFLCLVALNVLFIMGLLWFLHQQGAGRERVITQLLTACLALEERQHKGGP